MTEKEYQQALLATWNKLAENPRWMVAFPTERTCRKCHNGKIHYKTRIFLADCQNGTNLEDCLKCHPTMTKEYFERHRKKREQDRTTAMETGSSSSRWFTIGETNPPGRVEQECNAIQQERPFRERLTARAPVTR